MQDNLKYLKIVRKSPILFKIRKVMPEIIALCKAHAISKNLNYNLELNIKKLTEKLEEFFADSLQSLFAEKKEKIYIPGWAEGFIFGYVSSRLYNHWYGEYIYPQTKEYQELMILKSVINYLQFDQSLVQKIEKIYIFLTKNKAPITKTTDYATQKIIPFKKRVNFNEDFSNLLTSYLEKILLEKHDIIFTNLTEETHFFPLEKFFDPTEIRSLISQTENSLQPPSLT